MELLILLFVCGLIYVTYRLVKSHKDKKIKESEKEVKENESND